MRGEFSAIERIAASLPVPAAGETWIGDDAAVVHGRDGWLLLAADTVVAGVHADLSLTGVDDLGWKAMTANLSDLAAMGGEPGHALVTVSGPGDSDLDALYRGIGDAARLYCCPVVGGDLTNGPVLVVTVAVTGTVEGDPVLRSGARPGDDLWVTGPLGAAAAGLRLLRAGHARGAGPAAGDLEPGEAAAVRAHARPVPLLAEGRAARRAGATAMIDVSDGFAADLGHLADRSGVGFELTGLPIAPAATLEEAVGGGEDYQLIFSAPDADAVRTAFGGLPAPSVVGRVVADPGTRTFKGSALPPAGWQHEWQMPRFPSSAKPG
ncbi:thiamine-phosphate kinase [Acidiferrimicrobium sp. IK]|uniref:thiamine-phosphate kinase n=1 Tax=Acidiferrimicrobium sp. IK TaxID=2871700 RepID=UPI0021CAFA8A|nr:thiamine-phosphate kinase [Acidiferrimicrobium sp. IK]MCU4183797.1 thiamine-phosphate kinase [Acidiferrimicrobium sp. IK]